MIPAVDVLVAAAIGLASGVLSGLFGIGGGIVTTPAIRLLMGAPALIAVGTPLPVILPGALTGAVSFARRGDADVRGGVVIGASGGVTAVLGAFLARSVGGPAVLVGTAVIIALAAADMMLQVLKPPQAAHSSGRRARTPAQRLALAGVGLLTGVYSGFFGLGGGFVLVPMLTRWLRYPIKRAIGTSLMAVSLLAVPGSITHAALGNVDWAIAAGLAVGVVPGAVLGARLNGLTADRRLRLGFASLLCITAVVLASSELGVLR